MNSPTTPQSFRPFLIIWASQSLSLFGSAITYFAILVWVTEGLYGAADQRSQLALMLTAMSLVYAIASIVSAPVAGVWADRYHRKTLIIAADLASGAISGALALLLATQHLGAAGLLVLIALSAVVRSIHSAALDGSYVMVVPEPLLPRANGMMQTMWSLSGVLGPALATGLIAIPSLLGSTAAIASDRIGEGAVLALGIDMVTFLIAAIALVGLSIPSPEPQAGAQVEPNFLAEAKAGMRFVWREPLLFWIFVLAAITYFVFGPAGLLEPLIIKIRVAPDWTRLGYSYEMALAVLVAVGNIGGFIGGVLISWWGGFKTRRVYGALCLVLLLAAAQLAYGLSPLFYLTVLMSAVLNGTIPLVSTHLRTIIQTQTPPHMQGRAFAIYRLIGQAAIPSGTIIAGWASGIFDPGLVVATLSVLLVVLCISLLLHPRIRDLADRATPEPPATPFAVETS